MKKTFSVLLVAVFLLVACDADPNPKSELLLVCTTSTQDSGLLDVLLPAFTAQTGYSVQLVAVGSGQALKIGEQGNADVILLHSPAAEKEFVANGFGIDRRLVMHNDFVIVGPPSDPAALRLSQPTLDSVFKAIFASTSTFVSRGDESGTHVKELTLWKNAVAKGGSMRELVAEIYCRETGCSRGRGGSMHLIDPDVGMMGTAPIVAETISLAIGAALASSIRKDGQVTVTFFGDGATGEGVLYESLNFAALKKLPIVFACENNYYATHMPVRECRVDGEISRVAEPFCIESRQVDGMDVLEVYKAARSAVERCRSGNGPIFLEFQTYRFRGHVGPDDNIQGTHTDIRPQPELESWLKQDPILKFEAYLLTEQVLDQAALRPPRWRRPRARCVSRPGRARTPR